MTVGVVMLGVVGAGVVAGGVAAGVEGSGVVSDGAPLQAESAKSDSEWLKIKLRLSYFFSRHILWRL